MSQVLCGAEKYFHDSLKHGRFVIQRCQSCTHHIFYPRMICPHCGSDKLNWVQPTGLGTVYSVTVVQRQEERGGNYNVALINLEEGVGLMSRVDDLPPEDVFIGLKVKAQIKQIDDEEEGPVLVFVPAEKIDEL